jgi:hypothetical protein
MQVWKLMVLAPAIMLAAACSRRDQRATADSALNRDLNLANQVNPGQRLDSISPTEAGYAPTRGVSPAQPARTTTHTVSHRRHRSSGGRVYSSSGGAVSPQPAEVEVKHTQRDAAIGAAAGAIIGASTSHDKVKGAIVGGVVGGILGGVIGNNVDKTKKKP